MALSFLSPSRTVFFVGDETLSIYSVTPGAARLVESVVWTAPDFDARVTRLTRHECGGKPVLVVNDMTDQHFKGGQRMPKVGPLDKRNVLDRKMQVAFPNYAMRGALEIKQSRKEAAAMRESSGKEAIARSGGGLYLFAAIPPSQQISQAIQAVRQSLASVAGFVMLPVEAVSMVNALASKLSGKDRKPSRWTFFISQHRDGSLRQIVSRDGQLALTRMTAIADPSNPAQWAADVSQQLKATVSYLSRQSYMPEDATDVIVIAESSAGEALKDMIEIPCNYMSFTVNEAARILGIGIGLQEDQAYGDPLHAAWIGRKTRFALPISASEISNVSRPRQYAAAAMFMLMLGTAYLSWQMVSQLSAMSATKAEIEKKSAELKVAESEQEAETSRLGAMGFDVKLIKASIEAYDSMRESGMDPMKIVSGIGKALGGELSLSNLTVETVDPEAAPDTSMSYTPDNGAQASSSAKKDVLATLVLNFPSTIEPGEGVGAVNGLQDRLKQAFPGYAVTVTRQVAGMDYTANTSGQVGVTDESSKEGQPQDYVAELQIRGPAQ